MKVCLKCLGWQELNLYRPSHDTFCAVKYLIRYNKISSIFEVVCIMNLPLWSLQVSPTYTLSMLIVQVRVYRIPIPVNMHLSLYVITKPVFSMNIVASWNRLTVSKLQRCDHACTRTDAVRCTNTQIQTTRSSTHSLDTYLCMSSSKKDFPMPFSSIQSGYFSCGSHQTRLLVPLAVTVD